MIKEFAKKWARYNKELEDYFRNTRQEEYDSYKEIVKILFEKVINRDCDGSWNNEEFNTEEITVLDHGDYQGTQIFILHKDSYQPNVEEYVYTNTYYGSCSGCDTLQWISEYGAGLPSEEQIKDYMELALHLLQKCKFMLDGEKNEI